MMPAKALVLRTSTFLCSSRYTAICLPVPPYDVSGNGAVFLGIKVSGSSNVRLSFDRQFRTRYKTPYSQVSKLMPANVLVLRTSTFLCSCRYTSICSAVSSCDVSGNGDVFISVTLSGSYTVLLSVAT